MELKFERKHMPSLTAKQTQEKQKSMLITPEIMKEQYRFLHHPDTSSENPITKPKLEILTIDRSSLIPKGIKKEPENEDKNEKLEQKEDSPLSNKNPEIFEKESETESEHLTFLLQFKRIFNIQYE